MSAHQIWINRDEAEALVDILEDNYRTGKFPCNAGMACEVAGRLREAFGMMEQPPMAYKEAALS